MSGFMEKGLLDVFLRFVMGGMTGYSFTIFSTFILTDVAKFDYFISYVLALSMTIFLNFYLSMKYVFRVRERYASRFTRYLIAIFSFYLINLLLVRFIVETMKIHYLVSITIVTICLYVAKFYIYDTYIFHEA